MTKTVIAIRHVHFEDLGAFDDVLRRHGYAVRYCDACIDDIGGIDPLAPDLTAGERTRVGCGTAHRRGPKWAIPPFCRGAGSTLARRHLRPPEGGRASRFNRDLPKPGVQLRTPRARLPVPSRNHGRRVRALARRSRRRTRCRTWCFARGLAAGHWTPRGEVRMARRCLFVRMARPAA